MGHREDLLAGAKRCIFEKGYARTTARDIVAASGTNLASIGYHYGSKEALLNLALFEAVGEAAEEMERAMAAELGPDATPLERFGAFWRHLLGSFDKNRHAWSSTFEIYAEYDRMPQVRQMIAESTEDSRREWAKMYHDIDAAAEPAKAHAVGSIYHALVAGVLSQWLTDPEHAPSAGELAEGLRTIANAITASEPAGSGGPAAAPGT